MTFLSIPECPESALLPSVTLVDEERGVVPSDSHLGSTEAPNMVNHGLIADLQSTLVGGFIGLPCEYHSCLSRQRGGTPDS